jgi:chaperonin cofactor prefoldin
LEHGKSEYEKATEKNEELQEKNEVVNAQVSRMNNEHEELTIKFDNLQVSL